MIPERHKQHAFKNERMLITGAGGTLGKMVAERALSDGAEIIVPTRHTQPPEYLEQFLQEGKAHHIVADLSTNWQAVMDELSKRFSGCETMFFAAASKLKALTLIEMDSSQRDETFHMDVSVPMGMYSRWIQTYHQSKDEEILEPKQAVFLLSISSFLRWPAADDYQEAKAALAAGVASARRFQDWVRGEANEEQIKALSIKKKTNIDILGIYPDSIVSKLVNEAKAGAYDIRGPFILPEVLGEQIWKIMSRISEEEGIYQSYQDYGIIANPVDRSSGKKLDGIFLEAYPTDPYMHGPDFYHPEKRVQIADSTMLKA